MKPDHEPQMAYVVVNNYGQAVFSAPDFERALTRVGALMRFSLDCPNTFFRIEKVEAE